MNPQKSSHPLTLGKEVRKNLLILKSGRSLHGQAPIGAERQDESEQNGSLRLLASPHPPQAIAFPGCHWTRLHRKYFFSHQNGKKRNRRWSGCD
ncbi:hypothetical protein BC940DRAFT_178975 [Gongronella butleri]|nr:hypothetical protein BC940DRAFT_178975 [Gongronella butleri]